MAALLPSSWDLTINSWNLASRLTGKLSTQKNPRSSRARRKVPFPEPLRPVMMMKEEGCMGNSGTDPEFSYFRIRGPSPNYHPSNSCFGFYPPDITVLPFVDNVEALRLRVAEHQKIAIGIPY